MPTTVLDRLLREATRDPADLWRECHEAEYRESAWAWLTQCVSTVDELDPSTPIKPFPVAVCVSCGHYVGHAQRITCPRCGGAPVPLTYLEVLTRQWQSGEPKILLVPKARRMKITWWGVATHSWLAWRQPNCNVFFISSKLEKSSDLVERAAGILSRLPSDRCLPPHIRRLENPPQIQFLDTGSRILGVPEGSDQLRQYTATAIFADEVGTWENARAAYAAMVPTIEGGGRLTMVSSAYPGWWREAVSGELFG